MIQALDSIGFPWKVRHVKGWEEQQLALAPVSGWTQVHWDLADHTVISWRIEQIPSDP